MAVEFDNATLQWQSVTEMEAEAQRFNTLLQQRGKKAANTQKAKEQQETNVSAAVGAVWWEQQGPKGSDGAGVGEGEGIPPPGTLAGLNLRVAKGEVVAVVGSVGSGKSSILSALLGNMLLKSGKMYLNGSPAYVGHPATVFNDTLKGNILFGSEFDAVRYERVLAACALLPDLEALPAGDQTEIGERGVNVSGGQRARIALARSLYNPSSSVYLLDDPLSAVDAHTGRHLWEECIRGILKEKGATVIIATHQLQVLPDCDRIVVLGDGRIQDVGTFEELTSRGVDLRRLMAVESESEASEEKDAGDGEGGGEDGEVAPSTVSVSLADTPEEGGGNPQGGGSAMLGPGAVEMRRRASTALSSLSGDDSPDGGLEGKPGKDTPEGREASSPEVPAAARTGKLITVEEQSQGSLHLQVFLDYMSAAGGGGWVSLMFLFVVAGSVARLAADYFISFWVDDIDARLKSGESGFDQDIYVGVLGAIVGGAVVLQLVRGIAHAALTTRASRRLHNEVFVTIMRATSAFFDTTPVGRILNRVSGDMDIVDVRMPQVLELALNLLAFCGLTIIGIIIATPWFAIVMVPIIAGFLYVIRYFRRSVRELQRLEGITRSPLVSNVQATVQGLTTIRAYNKVDTFRAVNNKYVDQNTTAFFAWYGTNRWVAVRFDALTYSMAIACALLGVVTELDAGLAGLIVVYSLQISGVFQFATRQAAETESLFTAVERVLHYIRNVPKEPVYSKDARHNEAEASSKCCGKRAAPIEWHGSELMLPEWKKENWDQNLQSSWPGKGTIEFKRVVARYRPDLEPALRNLSLKLPGGKSVGIVGRTGSGKSTTTLTLFRLLEIESGSITVDGVPISDVQLFQLRSKLAIIPQDPVLFTGTIRSNLDPFNDFQEERLWEVLRATDLEGFVRSQAMGLDREVTEGGTNLSVGQRQLICLARAMLRGARIVVLDEATSAIDVTTDAMVQRVVAEHFKNCTLLIIAHRLETIMTCDYIAGLAQGTTEEFGPPATLLGFDSGDCDRFLEAAANVSPEATVESVLTTSLVDAAPALRKENGLLAKLVAQTGQASAKHLTAMALLSRGLKRRKKQGAGAD